jgi:septum formation protein
VAEKHPFSALRPVLLASTSRHRKALLERLRIPFETVDPGVDEQRAAGEAPRALAARLALAKARSVAARHPGALVIGSDQVCAAGDWILGKPASVAANREMLARLSGCVAVFHTAVAIVGREAGLHAEHLDETRCHFRHLSDQEIVRHVEVEPALDCAGGFKSEGLGIGLMTRMESEDPTGLIGLPLIWVASVLRPFLRPTS